MHAWEQIQWTLDYIETHLAEPLEIEDLARRAALSPFYYQRLFSRLVKKPVAEYVKLRRLARATEALQAGDSRILDIALELGFASHEHFTRSFRETFGMTPEAYRSRPQALNRMTKPQLELQYVLVDEGVPLVTEGIVLEITRQRIETERHYIGFVKKMPVSFVDGLGAVSGVDPLAALWDTLHALKRDVAGWAADDEEIGVTYPCDEAGYFNYFAGARPLEPAVPDGCEAYTLAPGAYIVCTFEAENFEALVMDALYKAEQYLFNTWLPRHGLTTEPFCLERYPAHAPDTTRMEIWLKPI